MGIRTHGDKWKTAKCREFRILGAFGANIRENLLFWKLAEREHEKLEIFSVLFNPDTSLTFSLVVIIFLFGSLE